MNDQTNSQLLRAYAEKRSEPAFSELVRRHVDFVYSAALRMVCDPHLAEDVTQGVFVALAKNALQLMDRPVLSGWLHRTAQNIAAQTVRTIERRRAREKEAAAMNELLSTEPDIVWEHIAPHLDAALGELNELDRDALLLRYFERKSAHEIAQTLGVSDEAAQKRVSRAVERLREFFAKRGVTVGASGLVAVVSANAIQAAPVGLAVTISTAAAVTAATVAIAATATVTKAIAMTTLQKTLVTATVAVLVGAGIYEARQASRLRNQVQILQQPQALQTEQIQQLTRERNTANQQVAALRDDNERLNRNTAELLKLRGEIGRLRQELVAASNPKLQTNRPSPAPLPHAAWRLREPRRLDEFQNVGNETAEAAAETVFWAAHNQPTNLLQMIHGPRETLNKAQDEGMSDLLATELAVRLLGQLRVSARGESQLVWLDGGNTTTFTQQGTTATNTYAGVVSFNLSGRENSEDPATERHTNLLFAKIDGAWKLVIPGFSPEIPEKKE